MGYFCKNAKTMVQIAILIPDGPSILSSIIGTHHVFTGANEHLQSLGKRPVFQVQLVGLSDKVPFQGGLYSIHPDTGLEEAKQADLVIVPALDGNLALALARNKEFIPWLREQYRQGAELASLCTGAFLLASTGLLKGRKCATHWMAATAFQQLFPDVDLIAETIITDEKGIYSSGGAYSFLNLILYLVEKYAGRPTAIFCSKAFEIDFGRSNQSPFTIFQGQKTHEDEPIRQAQLFMENNVKDKISVDRLASMFALSRRNFERRFKKATANTPAEYLQRIKIEAAKQSLERGRASVTDIMYEVGYTDSKAFRMLFRRITGLSPVEYRNKYTRESVAS
jgi:transcriptional regulator GlxA family with amidase domain